MALVLSFTLYGFTMNRKVKKFISSENSLNLSSDLGIDIKGIPSPFDRNNGFTLCVLSMSQDAPHDGEMHPDGDEFIYVISGCLEVILELERNELVTVNEGEGLVIPKGVWHKVHVVAPAQIMTFSPGPGFEYRDKV